MEIGLLVFPVKTLDFRSLLASKYGGTMAVTVWRHYKFNLNQ